MERPCVHRWRFHIVKMFILSKAINESNAISVKIPMAFFLLKLKKTKSQNWYAISKDLKYLKWSWEKKTKHFIFPDFKTYFRDFPGGSVVKNLPCSTRDMSSIPGQGAKIAHATGQVSPHVTAKTQHSQINKYFFKNIL